MNADWFRAHLPGWLLREGPWHVEHWQWLVLAAGFVVSWVVGRFAGRATTWVLRRLVSRTRVSWDDEMVRRLSGPFTFGWMLVLVLAGRSGLDLPPKVDGMLARGLRSLLVATAFWALLRSVDVLASALVQSEWTRTHPGTRTLFPLGGAVVKTLLGVMGLIMIVSDLGYPVASLLAGLGVGGIALALASQKTVENLFGAFSIGVDQPFRVGDFIRLEGMVGTVEALGLRSTRVRTLDRTLVTIPNAKLSEMHTESMTARDRMRLNVEIGIEYRTTADQMRQVLEGLRGALRAHPKLWPHDDSVRLKAFDPSALTIEVNAWFATSDWNEFMAIREEMLLAFMDVVEKAGTAFAFPTQTVYVRGEATPG